MVSDGQVRRRGRPRDEGAGDRILDAALEEYAERGWAGFTMDGVARRAGVGKSTIYLRWREKEPLLVDAVAARVVWVNEVDTGTFDGDLRALATNLFHHYLDRGGWTTMRMAVDGDFLPAPIAGLAERIRLEHRSAVSVMVGRAIERGELATDAPVDTLVECLVGSVTIQVLLLTGDERRMPDDEIADRVERLVGFLLAAMGR